MKFRYLILICFYISAANTAIAAVPTCNPDAMAAAGDHAHIPQAYMHPPLMAVGDSLFNGMTSLTIDGPRAHYSPPADVARSLGVQFREVAYPRPVLMDLERELKKAPLDLLKDHPPLHSLGHDISADIRDWQRTYPHNGNIQVLFDDLAVAGASSGQLICDTPNFRGKWVSDPISPGRFDIPDNLSQWHYAINTSFVLNPSDAQAYRGLSQLAEVRARKPTRLLISIGANDGLWLMAFSGFDMKRKYVDDAGNTTTIPQEFAQLVINMKTIARLIPADTKHVYYDNLVSPSRVANLGMSDSTKIKCKPDARAYPNGEPIYLGAYETYLNSGRLVTVSAQDACEMDRVVSAENQAIVTAMRNILGNRFVVVDLNSMLWKFDRKHLRTSSTLDVNWGGHRLSLDNRVVHSSLSGWISSGGIAGYDNMHPTLVTYAKIAQVILGNIAPDGQLPPRIAANEVTPQRVTDELRQNAIPTAIRMGMREDYNLQLVSSFLRFLRKKANPNLTMTVANTSAACALQPTFTLFSHTSAQTAPQVASACAQAESRFMATFR